MNASDLFELFVDSAREVFETDSSKTGLHAPSYTLGIALCGARRHSQLVPRDQWIPADKFTCPVCAEIISQMSYAALLDLQRYWERAL